MQYKPDWHGSRMMLYSERGYHLTIRSNGQILGREEDNDLDSRLQIISAGQASLVKIQGLQSRLYVCFHSDGNLYAEADPQAAGTVFEEHFQGSYSAFKSTAYPSWFVGIDKNGQAKNGNRTRHGQKAVKFLPRRNF